MSIQFISDSKGVTTGVFIPISEWNELKKKYHVSEEEHINIPDWQKEIVKKRIQQSKPEDYLSWDEIKNQLKMT